MKRFLMITLLILSGCSVTENDMGYKNVEITTEDGIKLAGDLYRSGETGIILLHMYTANKKSWEDFALELQNKGYSVLAIDFRGHGSSDLSYNHFTEEDFNKMILDARAAKNFLNKEKNIVVGASIGANIVLKFVNEVDGGVALSPSFNYKGVKTEEAALEINNPILIIVSDEDVQSINDSKELHNLIVKSQLEVYSGKGHGTRMLDRQAKDRILDWLDENI